MKSTAKPRENRGRGAGRLKSLQPRQTKQAVLNRARKRKPAVTRNAALKGTCKQQRRRITNPGIWRREGGGTRHEYDPKFTVVLAATQEALEQLEAGGVVVDSKHAHADGELVLPPVPARLPQRLHLLHGHLLPLRLLRGLNSSDAKGSRNRTSPAAAFLRSLLAKARILEIQERRGKACEASKVKAGVSVCSSRAPKQ
jgi:hypothetical protein